MRDHPVYYAGPAKTPKGYASGSFGPTTAGRMDSYVDAFQVRPAPQSAPQSALPPHRVVTRLLVVDMLGRRRKQGDACKR